jgi:hypothetical protein
LADIRVIDAEFCHIAPLAATMRDEDVAELRRFGLTPYMGLWKSYCASIIRRVALIDGEVVAMFGVCGSLLGVSAHPWLLSSDKVKQYPLVAASMYRKEVRSMLKVFNVLEGFVIASYSNYLRLLHLVGFTVSEPVPYGKDNELYCHFVMRA